jgi:hypothetical protein
MSRDIFKVVRTMPCVTLAALYEAKKFQYTLRFSGAERVFNPFFARNANISTRLSTSRHCSDDERFIATIMNLARQPIARSTHETYGCRSNELTDL